jgi:signal transduction histidine kinase/ActR/RegA family two-component response regulator
MPTAVGASGRPRAWPSLGRRAANILALTSFALLILVGALATGMALRVNRAAYWVAHSLEAQARAAELFTEVQDIELGQRGYLLTRSDAYLAPYERARAAIPQSLASLRSHVADNSEQTSRVARIEALIDEMLATSAKSVELGQKGKFAEAVDLATTGRGPQILESARASIGDFGKAESDLLKTREASESFARSILLGLVLLGLVSAAGAALGALSMSGALIRELRQRSEALARETRERKEAQAMLVQTQKMESIGLLAGGIAHDFNNLMTVVIGNLDIADRRIGRPETIDRALVARPIAAALQGARRAASLTQRLLAFSRQQVLAPQQVELNRLVSGLSDMVTRTVGETIAVETILASGLWRTFADPSQLENAIINLVVNARDAMPDGGRITIETANAYLDEAYCAQFGDVTPGQYVLLSVSDTGTGISPENLARVFEPFFTTKGEATRTGLGLAMIHGFVKQSKGHVRIYSERGHGTTAKLYMPRAEGGARIESAPPAAHEQDAHIPRAIPDEVVLIVEDDDDVRDSTVALLKDLGYSVLAARTGPEALERLKEDGRIDVLFTDVVLPEGMNGRMLANAAAALRPALPVLFTTGYARNAIIHDGRLDPGVQFLAKPYTEKELARKLRAVIDAAVKT